MKIFLKIKRTEKKKINKTNILELFVKKTTITTVVILLFSENQNWFWKVTYQQLSAAILLLKKNSIQYKSPIFQRNTMMNFHLNFKSTHCFCSTSKIFILPFITQSHFLSFILSTLYKPSTIDLLMISIASIIAKVSPTQRISPRRKTREWIS